MASSKRVFDYKILHKIELQLNTVRYKGLEIGNLLSFYFDRLYRDELDMRFFLKLYALLSYFFKSHKWRNHFYNHGKKIIYFRTNDHRHYLNMQAALIENDLLKNETLIVSPKSSQGMDQSVFFSSKLVDFLNVILFVKSNKKIISSHFDLLNLSWKIKIIFFFDLIIQLLKALSLKEFITLQTETALIGADYDRGFYSSLFFAVAKSLKIKSFTFQHGVINPPIGYSPVNAHEIWVWGNMARKQLIKLGVSKNQIRIVGTPIVQDIDISDDVRNICCEKYDLKKGSNVILALSAPNKSVELKLVNFFAKLKKRYATSNDNYLVKLHPARQFKNYSWITTEFDLDILPHDIPYNEFMNILDILLADNSGIANEAQYYGKKVGIINILNTPLGNGFEMNKYYHTPLIKKIDDFGYLLNDFKVIKNDFTFYKVGEKAKHEIQQVILEVLRY